MILGLDWGQKKIGMAISHNDIAIASAIGIIKNDVRVFDELQKIIKEYEIDLIVIGRSAHQTQNDNTGAIDIFARRCFERLNVRTDFVSEMFSTKEAQSNLKAAGKKNVAQIDDAESARIILQQYMDANK